MIYRRYLRLLGTVVACSILLTITLNVVVDPFGIFGVPRVSGFNALKPDLIKHDRAAKAWMVQRADADALILGNSRALNGIPTNHRIWSGFKVFNGAFSGGWLGEAVQFLEFAHGEHPVRRVLLSVDETSYMGGGNPTANFNPARYDHSLRGSMVRANDALLAVLTDVAAAASFRTLRARHGPLSIRDTYVVNGDGSIDFGLSLKAVSLRGGPRSTFRAQDMSYVQELGGRGSENMTGIESALADATLRRVLTFCRQEGIELVLFIPPLHARRYALMELANKWDSVGSLRNAVVRVIEEEAIASRAAPFPVLDFGGVHAFSIEPIPSEGGKDASMRWFFESSHFTPHLGDVILERAFGTLDGDQATEKFGMRLTMQNVGDRIRRLREDLSSWKQTHSGEYAELVQLYSDGRATMTPPSSMGE